MYLFSLSRTPIIFSEHHSLLREVRPNQTNVLAGSAPEL